MSVFWEHMVRGIAQRWSDRLLSPALGFWLAGAYFWGRWAGWGTVATALDALPTPLQVLVLVVALLVVAGSAAVVEGLQESVLHLMEGYWPRLLRPLWRWRVRRQQARRRRIGERLNALANRWSDLSPQEVQEYARLDAERRAYPRTVPLLPTRLGNVLRAAEEHARVRYGLVAGVVWPHLWFILPKQVREDIAEAREHLNAAVRLCIWGLLFLVWLRWALSGTYAPLPAGDGLTWLVVAALNAARGGWPGAVGIGMMAWGYRRALAAARVYGELLRAAFDLYWHNLYEALKWPEAEDEKTRGDNLTQFLWRENSGTNGIATSWPSSVQKGRKSR